MEERTLKIRSVPIVRSREDFRLNMTLGLSMRDFPEQNYPWEVHFSENDLLPPIYHGTSSYFRDQILAEGLKPGTESNEERGKSLARILSIIDDPSLTESQMAPLFQFKLLGTEIYKALYCTLKPIQAAGYATRSPELLMMLNAVLEDVLLDIEKKFPHGHPLFDAIEKEREKCATDYERIQNHPPMVITFRTQLDRFDSLPILWDPKCNPETKQYYLSLLNPTEEGSYQSGGVGLNLRTRDTIPASDIVALTYLER